MAAGDLTLTNHGDFDISGAALKTTVDAINLTQGVGAALHLIHIPGTNKLRVIQVDSAA
jgi:hypothetical protein